MIKRFQPPGHQTSFGHPMDVYMKFRLHIEIHWTTNGRLMSTGKCALTFAADYVESIEIKGERRLQMSWTHDTEGIYMVLMSLLITMFKFNNKDTRATSVTLFRCLTTFPGKRNGSTVKKYWSQFFRHVMHTGKKGIRISATSQVSIFNIATDNLHTKNDAWK